MENLIKELIEKTDFTDGRSFSRQRLNDVMETTIAALQVAMEDSNLIKDIAIREAFYALYGHGSTWDIRRGEIPDGHGIFTFGTEGQTAIAHRDGKISRPKKEFVCYKVEQGDVIGHSSGNVLETEEHFRVPEDGIVVFTAIFSGNPSVYGRLYGFFVPDRLVGI